MKLMKTLTAAIALGAFSLMATPTVTLAKGKPEQSQSRGDKPCKPERKQSVSLKADVQGDAWNAGGGAALGQHSGVSGGGKVTKHAVVEGRVEQGSGKPTTYSLKSEGKFTADGEWSAGASDKNNASAKVADAGGATIEVLNEVTIKN